MITRTILLSLFAWLCLLVVSQPTHGVQGAEIADEEMRSAIIALEKCAKRDKTVVSRPFTPVCGVPVYSRQSIEQNLFVPRKNNYKATSIYSVGNARNTRFFYLKRDRDSQVVIGMERSDGRAEIVGIGVSMYAE